MSRKQIKQLLLASTLVFSFAARAQENDDTTRTPIGAWTLFCHDDKAEPATCALIQSVRAENHPETWLQILLGQMKGEFVIKIRTAPLAYPSPSLILDGVDLGSLRMQKCDQTACETMIHPRSLFLLTLSASQELQVTLPIGANKERGLIVDLSDLSAAMDLMNDITNPPEEK